MTVGKVSGQDQQGTIFLRSPVPGLTGLEDFLLGLNNSAMLYLEVGEDMGEPAWLLTADSGLTVGLKEPLESGWAWAICFRRVFDLLNDFWQRSHVRVGPEPVVDSSSPDPACTADLLLLESSLLIELDLGLCQRRWEARFAGQLKTLSHSGHLYSTWTIMEHLQY